MPPDADPDAPDDRTRAVADASGADADAREAPDLSPPCRSPGSPDAGWPVLLGVLARGLDRHRLRPPGQRGAARPRRGPRRWSPRTTSTLATEVAGLERELEQIQRQRYIDQQARGYGLGGDQGDPVQPRRRTPRRSPPTPRARPRVRLGADRRRASARSSAG